MWLHRFWWQCNFWIGNHARKHEQLCSMKGWGKEILPPRYTNTSCKYHSKNLFTFGHICSCSYMGRIESKFTSRDELGNKAMSVCNISYNPLLSKTFAQHFSLDKLCMILTKQFGVCANDCGYGLWLANWISSPNHLSPCRVESWEIFRGSTLPRLGRGILYNKALCWETGRRTENNLLKLIFSHQEGLSW